MSYKLLAVIFAIILLTLLTIKPELALMAFIIGGLLSYFLNFKEESNHALFLLHGGSKTPTSGKEKLVHFLFLKQNYLNTKVWNEKRKLVLARDNYTCQSCGCKDKSLSVHHLSGYNKIPYESTNCLVALCQDCHTKQHEKLGYPQSYQEYMNWDVKLV